MWDLPRSGIDPVSPASAGGFLSIVWPGKPSTTSLSHSCLTWEDFVAPLHPPLPSGPKAPAGYTCIRYTFLSSVQFSRSVVSDSLRPHELQHARPPCPSPTPRVYSNSCPSRRWCHPTISSSVTPFSSCPQSFPVGSFQMSQFFASGAQSIGDSISASVLPMNTQDWSPLGWTGWISLQSKGLSRVFSNTTVQKHQFFGFIYSPVLTSIHDHWKNHSLD